MAEFDAAFIEEPEHRPRISFAEAEGIPVIDLSPIHSSKVSTTDGVVREIGNACKDWGFFQVINHGVPLEKRQKIEDVSKKFFAQSLEDKNKVRKNEKEMSGYYDTEHTKDVKDWKEIFDFTIEEPTMMYASHEPDDDEVVQCTTHWPEYPPKFREICRENAEEMVKLAHKLMKLIALSLGLPADKFSGFFKNQTSFVRLNRYPPCPFSHLALGVGPHKDPNSLTILYQDDVGGLEVKRKTDGEWVCVKPTPNAFIVNLSSIMQVWSNDRYESVEHRVVLNSERERFSIVAFFGPAYYTVVEPMEELTNEQSPAKYRPYSWGKFAIHRKRSNFQKLKEENLQIYHFRI